MAKNWEQKSVGGEIIVTIKKKNIQKFKVGKGLAKTNRRRASFVDIARESK